MNNATDLRIFDSFVDLGVQVVTASHLANVHPTGQSVALKDVSKDSHIVLDLPLIADEDLRMIHLHFYTT